MPIDPKKIAFQVEHMFLSDENKQRLIKEILELNEEKLIHMAQLIAAHDEEVMAILEKKTDERKEIKDRITLSLTGEPTPDETAEAIGQMKEVLTDPKKMGEFFAMSDDVVLAAMEDVMLEVLEDNPEELAHTKQFFQEIRLQKAAFDKMSKEKMKEVLTKMIEEREEQMAELNKVVAEAKAAMEKADKNN